VSVITGAIGDAIEAGASRAAARSASSLGRDRGFELFDRRRLDGGDIIGERRPRRRPRRKRRPRPEAIATLRGEGEEDVEAEPRGVSPSRHNRSAPGSAAVLPLQPAALFFKRLATKAVSG